MAQKKKATFRFLYVSIALLITFDEFLFNLKYYKETPISGDAEKNLQETILMWHAPRWANRRLTLTLTVGLTGSLHFTVPLGDVHIPIIRSWDVVAWLF